MVSQRDHGLVLKEFNGKIMAKMSLMSRLLLAINVGGTIDN